MHATLLRHLFHLVEAGHVTVPLFDGGQFPTNQAFMREHVANLLKSSFPNLTHQQVVDFVRRPRPRNARDGRMVISIPRRSSAAST